MTKIKNKNKKKIKKKKINKKMKTTTKSKRKKRKTKKKKKKKKMKKKKTMKTKKTVMENWNQKTATKKTRQETGKEGENPDPSPFVAPPEVDELDRWCRLFGVVAPQKREELE